MNTDREIDQASDIRDVSVLCDNVSQFLTFAFGTSKQTLRPAVGAFAFLGFMIFGWSHHISVTSSIASFNVFESPTGAAFGELDRAWQ